MIDAKLRIYKMVWNCGIEKTMENIENSEIKKK